MRTQGGVTLIETAIVMVTVGFLLGSVLKVRELIIGAEVRHLITQQDKIKAAYFGFYDRYRALPGDYHQATTNIPGISGCGGNGNGNGRIENNAATPPSEEYMLVWEHLSRAGFIAGGYTCNSTESVATTPLGLFGAPIQLSFDARYASLDPEAPPRHNLKTGNQIPSEILAEIDRKADDGSATGGNIRFSDYHSGGHAPNPENCFRSAPPHFWISTIFEGNCGAAFLL